MMQNLLRPVSLLLYLLAILVFLLTGMFFVAFTGVAEGQGLAGGATVLWYGIIFGFFSFIAAFVFVYFNAHKTIVKANWVLAIVLVVWIALIGFRVFDS